MDDAEKQAILKAIEEMTGIYHDAVKYPQLRIPDRQLKRLSSAQKLLASLVPRRA